MPLHKSRFLEKQTYDRFRLLFKLINILKIIIVFPISILLIIIYPFFKIKLGRIYSKTIGNSVSAIEIFFYESKEFVNKNNKKFYVWYHDPIIANKFWIKKIKKKIIVLPGIIIQPLTQIFKFLKLENKFKIPIRDFKSSKNPALIRSIANLSPTSDIHGVLSKYPPLIKFNSDELVRGECFLNHIGIKQNDKIVCIHNRSNSYRDENFNSLRNSSIKNFQSAIEFLLNKNIKVIRMGRDEKKKFNLNKDGFFDYSSSDYQDDFLDFYLISKCEFFVGAASGIIEIAKIFRKPIMIHNILNLRDMIHYVGDLEKIVLPKKIWSNESRSFLNFNETLKNDYNSKNLISDLNKNLEVFENTSEELYHAIKEMYNIVILKDNFYSNQTKFFRLYDNIYKNPLVKKVKISYNFFEKNINLF